MAAAYVGNLGIVGRHDNAVDWRAGSLGTESRIDAVGNERLAAERQDILARQGDGAAARWN
jgi:hypothetical protein